MAALEVNKNTGGSGKKVRWTTEETARLRARVEMGVVDFAGVPGRTEAAVKQRARLIKKGGR
jgi:hypothetical protein